MRLYDFTMAPNPRRVRIFLAEKGIQVPSVQVNLGSGENREPEFLQINPYGGVPVLELDDSTKLAESIAICRYFEAQKPEPRLFGGPDAREAALVEMWNRRLELNLLNYAATAFRNTSEFFKGRIPQVPEYGKISKDAAEKQLEFLDQELANRQFIAGENFTVADITALVAVDFGRAAQIKMQPGQKNLARWHQTVSARPSAKA